MMARVSLLSPSSARVVDALKSRSRTARFFSDACTGCCVVFWSGSTHLPSSLRCLAASAAEAISASLRPSSSALSLMTSPPAFVAARRWFLKFVESVASSVLSTRSLALSASESAAPARTKSR